MRISTIHSTIGARQVGAFAFDAADITDAAVRELSSFGINIPRAFIADAMAGLTRGGYAMDSVDVNPLGSLSAPSITTPIQFLQNWLPGFVRVISAARNIDEFLGMSTVGSWEDEEVVQGIMEPVGSAVPYSDYGNMPLSSWNAGYERRTVVRFEQGMQVGALEEARAAKVRIASGPEKRTSAALALEIARNRVGFFGYNGGNNRTYGFLNDPSLPAYVTVPAGTGGTTWATKTYLEIVADLRNAYAKLRTQSQSTIDPKKMQITLALPTAKIDYLSTGTDFGNVSVLQWIKENYPNTRIEDAPELNGANGGADVFYMYAESVDDSATDDSRTFVQIVPAKFQPLGVEKRAKSYAEDYTNATAGVLCKRPYAVVRYSGI